MNFFFNITDALIYSIIVQALIDIIHPVNDFYSRVIYIICLIVSVIEDREYHKKSFLAFIGKLDKE